MEKEQGRESPQLYFKPINEGLGFHPFSDGLPYAPVSKKSRSNGVGATAAGTPLFAKTLPKIAPAPKPEPTPQSLGLGVGNIPVASAVLAPAAAPAPQPQNSLPTVAEVLSQASTYGMGYVTRRILAHLLDTGLNLGLCAAGLSAVMLKQDLSPDLLLSPGVALGAVLFVLFFNWSLIASQEIAFGTSFGKRMFGLAIPGGTTTLIFRSILFLPSIGLCGLGLLWSLFDGQKRCWHDLATGVQPQRIAKN